MSPSALHMSRARLQKSLSDPKARGIRFRTARDLRGLSQEAAAKLLDVSRQTVSGWENGAEIEEENLAGASTLYRASRGWLRYGEGEPPAGLMEPAGEVPPDLRARGQRVTKKGRAREA